MTSKHVPEDVLVDILLKLPVKSLLRFQCVCKEWRLLLDSEYFRLQHLEYSRKKKADCVLVYKRNHVISLVSAETLGPILPDIKVPLTTEGVTLSGPVNGIVSVSRDDGCIYICNPSTRELKKLPPCVYRDTPELFVETVAEGFGIDEKNNDYKLVRIIHRNENYQKLYRDYLVDTRIEIYSLGSDCWQELKGPSFCRINIGLSPQGYLNGAYHWFVFHYDQRWWAIMYFRMDTEVFDLMLMPPVGESSPTIFVSDTKNLSLIYYKRNKEDIIYEVWVMMEYGVKESWSKQYTVGPLHLPDLFSRSPYTRSGIQDPVLVSIGGKNNELLLRGRNGEIVLCDLHDTQKVKALKACKIWTERPLMLAFYVESLVSIDRARHAT